MSEEIIGGIIIVSMLYLSFVFAMLFTYDFDLYFINPVRFYRKWCYTLNLFGIGIITLFANIIFLPYAILYWLIKLIIFIMTVGRKEEDNE